MTLPRHHSILPERRPSQLWPAVAGALAAAALLLAVPSHLDAEGWSSADATWRNSAWVLWALYSLALALAVTRLRARSALAAVALPLVLVGPTLALLHAATDLPWSPASLLLLATALPPLLLTTWLAAGALTSAPGASPAVIVPLAMVGLLIGAGVRYSERVEQEELIASGQVERLLRDLAVAIREDFERQGEPPASASAWLAQRLDVPGWQADGDLVYWAPSPEAGPGPVRLQYIAPGARQAPWPTILRTEDLPQLNPEARPFHAQVAVDGMLEWSWPAGPPRAVEERRRALELVGAGTDPPR